MHHEFFAWVRLLLFIVMVLAFAFWLKTAESQLSLNQVEQNTAAETLETPPTEADAAPQPTFSTHAEENTSPTKSATIVTEPPTEQETTPTYTEEELDMLALVIYQEAGGDACSDDTRLKVGTVVMNRIADKRYPNTMREVITQEAQYGRLYWTGLVWPQRASNHNEANAVERSYTIAERILQGERALPEDVVYQAEFPQGTEVVAYQDGHYFCR